MTNAAPHRIDVHHHIWSKDYTEETAAAQPNLDLARNWTAERSLEDMDQGGVATSIISVTTPGFWLGDKAQSARLAHLSNEHMARLVQDHPGRFGMFAALPLPDPQASLKEIEYGLDTLKADGIGLFTSYGDRWLGDPEYDPVFEELNRRRALVYVHPIAPDCCHNLVPDLADAVIEYTTDTTRAIARWMFSGSAARYPDVRFIWSHGGGVMPFIAERLYRVGAGPLGSNVPGGVVPQLQKFYYDVAQAAHPYALAALTRLVPISQILFGTDYPYRKASEYVQLLGEYGFSDKDLRAIDCDNALTLLPRFRK